MLDPVFRRHLLKLVAAGLGSAALPPLSAGAEPPEPAASAAAMNFLSALSDIVVPATATPGAGEVGVPGFVVMALRHGLADARGDEIDVLHRQLDAQAGRPFLTLDAAGRHEALAALDNAAFPTGEPAHPGAWTTLKTLILMGYYTSEPGGARELRYELVPGRFDPDLAYKKGDAAYSSDWLGVSFR